MSKYKSEKTKHNGDVKRDPYIKVTYLGRGWGVRCYSPDGSHFTEGQARTKEAIGPVARELLRWWDKMGGISHYAHCARHRAWAKARVAETEHDKNLRNRDMAWRRFDAVKLELH